MTTVYFKLNKTQLRTLHRAVTNRSAFNLTLTKKQIADSMIESNSMIAIPLNKAQLAAYSKAKFHRTGVTFVFTARAFSKTGGFLPIIPLLLAALPGLLGGAPEILKGVAGGYKNLAKLGGIKVDEAAPAPPIAGVTPTVDPPNPERVPAAPQFPAKLGSGTQIFGASVASDVVEFIVGAPRGKTGPNKTGRGKTSQGKKKGSSLKIFGEGNVVKAVSAKAQSQTPAKPSRRDEVRLVSLPRGDTIML